MKRLSLACLLVAGCAPPRRAADDDDRLLVRGTAPEAATAPTPAGTGDLVLNEVMAKNESSLMDDDLDFPDWVEILNRGTAVVPLDAVSLQDSSHQTWSGPSGESLAPGEFLLVFADDDASAGPLHAPFALASEGDTLDLAVDGAIVDRIATGPLEADISWARFPDGGTWQQTGRPSPGWSNGAKAGPVDPTEDIFQVGHVHDVELWISEDSWTLLDTDTNPDPSIHQNLQVPISFAFQGAYFPTVSAHIKGAWGSRRSMEQKVALKVNLDAYEDHHLRSLESVTLNNMVQDLSYIHEYLAYTVYRAAGVPAPRVGWTRLTINDTYRGLYLWVETEDDPFLERWYADPSGNLYEGAYGVDFYTGYELYFEYEEGGDPKDRSDLTAVIDVVSGEATDEAIAALDELVDLDEVLTNMAVEVLIEHWDGYTTSNNYRMYHDPTTGRFQIIPWGTDQTFVSYGYSPWGGYGRLFTFCLENAACKARYDGILLDTIDLMEGLGLETLLDEAVDAIDEDVGDDTWREYDMSYVRYYQSLTRDTIAAWPEQVRAQVE